MENDKLVAIHAPIGNIFVAAADGQKKELLHSMRAILGRIKKVNPLTSRGPGGFLEREDAFPV